MQQQDSTGTLLLPFSHVGTACGTWHQFWPMLPCHLLGRAGIGLPPGLQQASVYEKQRVLSGLTAAGSSPGPYPLQYAAGCYVSFDRTLAICPDRVQGLCMAFLQGGTMQLASIFSITHIRVSNAMVRCPATSSRTCSCLALLPAPSSRIRGLLYWYVSVPCI